MLDWQMIMGAPANGVGEFMSLFMAIPVRHDFTNFEKRTIP